jgi:hypothetical protein
LFAASSATRAACEVCCGREQIFDGTALVETYLGEHGSIVNNFERSADGKSLLRNVTVKGD